MFDNDNLFLQHRWTMGINNLPKKQCLKRAGFLAITIKIGQRVIPLCIRPVGKQGRGNTSKPDIFRDMLHSMLELYKQNGIDLNRSPITFDSWYGFDDLVGILKEKGFDQIIVHAKSNYVFTICFDRSDFSADKEPCQTRN